MRLATFSRMSFARVGAAPEAGIESVTGNPSSLVDNTDPRNPIVQPSFGENTSVSKANAAAALKTILQLIAAYTNNAAGVEASSWTVKVLQAGAQLAGQIITGVGTLFPDGVYDGTPSNSRASVALGAVGTGFRRYTGYNAVAVQASGREIAYIGDEANNGTGTMRLISTFAKLLLGDDCKVGRSVDATVNQCNLELSASFNGNPTDVVAGAPGVLANNANGGFFQLPTCAGAPTGAPLPNTGKAPECISDTGTWSRHSWYLGGAWKTSPLGMETKSGAVLCNVGTPGFSYLTDMGPVLATTSANETIQIRRPISARLITRLRATALAAITIPLVVTLYKNGASTALSLTIPATAVAGDKFLATGGVLFADGDDYDIRIDVGSGASGLSQFPVSATIEWVV